MIEISTATLASFSLSSQSYHLTLANRLPASSISFTLNVNDTITPDLALIIARDNVTGKVITTYATRSYLSVDTSSGTAVANYSAYLEYPPATGVWEIQAIGLVNRSWDTQQLITVDHLALNIPKFVVTSDDITPPQFDFSIFPDIGTSTNPIWINAVSETTFNAPPFAYDINLSFASLSFSNDFSAGFGFNAELYDVESKITLHEWTPSGRYSAQYGSAMDYFGNSTQLVSKNLLPNGIYVINPDKPGILDSGYANGKFWIKFSEQVTLNGGRFYLSCESSIGTLNRAGIYATDTQKIMWNEARDMAYIDVSDFIWQRGIYTLKAENLIISDTQGNQETINYDHIKEQDFKGPTQSFSEFQINESVPQDQHLLSMLALTNGKILVSYANFTDQGPENGTTSFAVLQKNDQGIINRVKNVDLYIRPFDVGSVALPDGGFAIVGTDPVSSSPPTIYFFNADGSPRAISTLEIPSYGLNYVHSQMGSAPWNYRVTNIGIPIITYSSGELKVIYAETREFLSTSTVSVFAYHFNEVNGEYQLSNSLPEIIADGIRGGTNLSLTVLPNGGFLTIEYDYYNLSYEMEVQRYDTDLAPVGSSLQLSMSDYASFYPLDNGQLAIIYRENSIPGAWGPGTTGEIRGKIFAMTDSGIEQIIPADASADYDGFLIDRWETYPPSTLPKISPDAKFLIYDDVPGRDEQSVRIKPFNLANQRVGEDFYDLGDYRWGEQFNGKLITLSDGSIFGAWSSYLQDGSGVGAFGRMIDDNFFNPGIHGTPGSDILNGTDVGDVMCGYGGNDRMFGLGGNDTFKGGTGNDLLDGGAGIDTADFSDKTLSVTVNLRSPAMATARVGNVNEDRLRNIENLIGGSGHDSLTGNGLVNVISGGSGDDTLDGGGGADALVGGAGNDTFVIDHAGDMVTELAGEGIDLIRTPLIQIDLIDYDHVENLTYTGRANSTLIGSDIDNVIRGGSRNDVIEGGAGSDTLYGGDGADLFFGYYFYDDEEINDGDGDPALSLTAFQYEKQNSIDRLYGGRGNDFYVFDQYVNIPDVIEYRGEGTDTIYGGRGRHVIPDNVENYINDTSLTDDDGNYLYVEITGNSLNNIIRSDVNFDLMPETAGLDWMATNIKKLLDSTSDYESNERFFGLAGNDTLLGGAGEDYLSGGEGRDRLAGGRGSDQFVFDAPLNRSTNVDTITDFVSGQDKIVLDHDVFAQFSVGEDVSDHFSATGRALDGDDYLVYNSSTKTLFYDADGNGNGAAVAFAVLTGVSSLSANDFLIM